jgi:hypothetical protein
MLHSMQPFSTQSVSLSYLKLEALKRPVSFGKQPAIPKGDSLALTDARFSTLPPEQLLNMPFDDSLNLLKERLGETTVNALLAGKDAPSPVAKEPDTTWFKRAKIVGVLPRVAGTYWGIVKYAMGCPEDAFHLLPSFVAGYEGNAYALNNFRMSQEFLDPDLQKLGFTTPEAQLKLAINTLHAMGKTVGMDVTMHTDRFSEVVFTKPEWFDWLELSEDKSKILTRAEDPTRSQNAQKLRASVVKFLEAKGDGEGKSVEADRLKAYLENQLEEPQAEALLFGRGGEAERDKRRVALMHWVRQEGLEPRPVVANPPYMPLRVKTLHKSADGTLWPEFTLPKQAKNLAGELVYGSLGAYKFYDNLPGGTPNLDRPLENVWQGVAEKYSQLQQNLGFDFMRVDLGHIQMASFPNGTGDLAPKHLPKEFLAYLKETLQQESQAPYFASFLESFLMQLWPHKDIFLDLEEKKAESALGYMHIKKTDPTFAPEIKQLNQALSPVRAATTVFTPDDDSPKNSRLLQPASLIVKLFTALFLDQPSYMGMGLETRETDETHFNKLTEHYIKQQPQPYEWGKNLPFFGQLTAMRQAYASLKPLLKTQTLGWLSNPAPPVLAWFYKDDKTQKASTLFVVNTDTQHEQGNLKAETLWQELPHSNFKQVEVKPFFSTYQAAETKESKATPPTEKPLSLNLLHHKGELERLHPGEGRIYKLS